MRYAKLQLTDGPLYVQVEDRDGVLWASAPMTAPEEDYLASALPAVHFRPGPLETFAVLAPVRPSKILCVGRNYQDHAAELGNDVPTEPLLFLKPPSAVLAPGGRVVMPALSKRVDFEGELAIVIGRRLRGLGAEEDPRPFIRGYTIVNDVTARDIQKSDGQWTRGKGYDTFCPVGPLVSDEIDPCGGGPVTVTTRLNGEVRQKGSTADLIFPIAELLRYISACMTLEPGDLIPTGTPAGVGPMQAGDTVEVEIAGLGVLRNRLVAEG
jgi:2-keto-4-pentenoate hydratase/2-oxohepta-3-ene-1,7-dioic acid hydratase in catechol pathway